MKVLLIVTVACLMSGAHAGAFGDTLKQLGTGIGSVFTDMFNSLKAPVTDVANQLVDNLKTAGTNLLATGASSLLGSLSKLGTRDLNEVMQQIQTGEQKIHKLAENVGALYQGAMHEMTTIGNKVSSMEFLKEPIGNLIDEVNQVVDVHSILQNGALKMLGDLFNKNKRNGLNLLAGLESQFADLFRPIISAATNQVGSLGSTLIHTATDLAHSIEPALHNLGSELGVHMQALKDSSAELLAQKA